MEEILNADAEGKQVHVEQTQLSKLEASIVLADSGSRELAELAYLRQR